MLGAYKVRERGSSSLARATWMAMENECEYCDIEQDYGVTVQAEVSRSADWTTRLTAGGSGICAGGGVTWC